MISHLRHLRAPSCISQLCHLGAPPSMISHYATSGRHKACSHNCATSGTTIHDLTTAPPRGAMPPPGATPPPGAVVISTTVSPQATTAITTVPYHHDHLDPATLGPHCSLVGGHFDPHLKGLPPLGHPSYHRDPSDLHSCATFRPSLLRPPLPFALSTCPLHGGQQHLH